MCYCEKLCPEHLNATLHQRAAQVKSSATPADITMPSGAVVVIDRPYDRFNKQDRMTFLDLQHRRGRQAVVIGKFMGHYVHNGFKVLVATTVTAGRHIIENDLCVVSWPKEEKVGGT